MNILLITSDQHRADCYGFAGRPVKTPHLDRLAAEGTWLRNCITPSVVCQPARASILTGRLPLTHGVCDNGIDLPEHEGERGFAAQLGRAGYRTGFVGKAHFSTYHSFAPTGRPECIHSAARFGDQWFGPYMGFEHVELMSVGHNWFLPEKPPGGLHYDRWYWRGGRGERLNRLYSTDLGRGGVGSLAEPPSIPQTFHSGLPVAFHNSTWVADRSIAFLRESLASPARRPFLLWASFPDPHHPFDCPEPWSRLHDPGSVDLPEHRRLDLERRPAWHRAYLDGVRQSFAVAALRGRPPFSWMPELPDGQLRELIANYFGMISLIDHNVGRILECLSELGADDQTLVVFTADHGEWLGDHGLILKGPMMYDSLLRVGAVVRGPQIAAGRRVDAPTSTIDLAATFADAAGTSMPPGQHGSSWLPWLRDGRSGPATEHALSEWRLGATRAGVALDLKTVRTARYRLTLEHTSGQGELYDFENDPHELENRFDDPGHRGVRAELEALIARRPADELDTTLPQVGRA